MNSDERLIALIEKYLKGNCTSSEITEVEQWYEQMADDQQSYHNGDKGKINQAAIASFNEIRSKVWEKNPDRRHKIMSIRHWYAAAAIVLVMLVSGLYFFRQYPSAGDADKSQVQLAKAGANIKPGSNQAVLTLANGSKIILNETKNGKIADQAGIKITKTADGRLIYTIAGMQPSSVDGTSLYNTITTPKGGQYQVVLPDGTHIWLNAASSIRYPAMFDPKYRKIELTGEGYFEVAKATNKTGDRIPFVVKTAKQQVDVLGTHFNINAYTDENATVTTLLEGSVRVLAGGQSALIVPGEHTVLNGTSLHTGPADMEGALAWKNGFFFFKNADIKTVMRQLARWYNVEVDYEGSGPLKKFSGEIYRNASITQVFDLLSYYKVNYRIETTEDGKNKLIIMR